MKIRFNKLVSYLKHDGYKKKEATQDLKEAKFKTIKLTNITYNNGVSELVMWDYENKEYVQVEIKLTNSFVNKNKS